MIVSFSVSNFTSFSTEETFSLLASNRVAGSHTDHAVPIPDSDQKVLRTAVLYGANGAGKSNLFKAIQSLESLAISTRTKKGRTGRIPFRFGGGSDEPSTFDLQFIAADKLYRYGIVVDDHSILQEWLVRMVGAREKALYERITHDDGKVTVELDRGATTGDKLAALAKVGGPQNQSFLATIRANLEAEDLTEDLNAIISWFEHDLTLIAPDSSVGALAHWLTERPNFVEFAGGFLRSTSTGVDSLEVSKHEVTEDEMRQLIPRDVASQILTDIAESGNGKALVRLDEGQELLVERTDDNHFYRISIQAVHKHEADKVTRLSLAEESDGTRRLLNLLPALHRLREGAGVYVIDEIDRSLHPILVRSFLEFFLHSCPGAHRQIIVTSHESSLLDLDLLRRDEIWFAEKDDKGATHLYSLLDFKVRNDLEIRKHYLQGRFGGVPFIGNLDGLLAEEHQPQ